jgi:hypothetical protein
MNSNRHDGLYHNGGAEITDEIPGAEGNDHLNFEDDDKDLAEDDERESARKRKRKRLVGLILALIILAASGAGLWMILGSRKTKIRIPVRDNTKKIDQSTTGSTDNNSVTAQAIADVRSAVGSPTPSPPPSPSPSPIPVKGVTGATVMSTIPVTVAMDGVGNAPRSSANETGQSNVSSGATGAARRGEIISRRNPERSIRCAPTPKPVSPRQPAAATPVIPSSPVSNLFKPAELQIPLPPFGAMLPARTLGALYTLRQSMVRLELTRDVVGDGWALKKGTVLVGQQQGSEHDRAYISLTGFIDPISGKLVKLNGDLLGADGAPGLKGKLHKVSSTWKRVLDRVVTSGVPLAQAALARGNSTTVVLPGAVAPELTSLTSTSRREFVEVPAASPAYILITRLPEQTQGVDAPPVTSGAAENLTTVSNKNGDTTLSDEEIAALMESGTPEAIRAAMPRMSPELQRIAEMTLEESSK